MKFLEYHPHNDNGRALENINYVQGLGVNIVGTSVFGLGERKTMIDPRLVYQKFKLDFDEFLFQEFERDFYKKVGLPGEIATHVFDRNIIVTGTQFRLMNRSDKMQIKFGVTSDKFILAKLIGCKSKAITNLLLEGIKNKFLYHGNGPIILGKKEICELDEVQKANLWNQ